MWFISSDRMIGTFLTFVILIDQSITSIILIALIFQELKGFWAQKEFMGHFNFVNTSTIVLCASLLLTFFGDWKLKYGSDIARKSHRHSDL